MKMFSTIAGLVVFLAATAYYINAAKHTEPAETAHVQTGKPQSSCPLMGGHVDARDMWVDVKGKRIYICCAACEDAIKTEPDKYIKIIEDRGEVVELTPVS